MKNTVYFLTKPNEFTPMATWLNSVLQPGYVRLRILACGICGSDISHFLGRRNIRYPHSLGHEFCGEVLESSSQKFFNGNLVVSDLNFRCGQCVKCTNNQSHLCLHRACGLFSNRAFAEFMDIHESYIKTVPGNIPPHLASLAEPLSCVLHAINQIGIIGSEKIFINGAGGIGALFVFALKAKGVDGSNIFIGDKLQRGDKVAVNFCINTAKKTENERFDIVIDATSSVDGFKSSALMLESGGLLVMFSHLDGLSGIDSGWHELTRKDARIILPYLNGQEKQMAEAMFLIGSQINLLDNITFCCDLPKIQDVFSRYPNPLASKVILTCR